jgi:aldehyde:ferredoxin oxidoreductase
VFDDLYADTARLLASVTGWDVTPDELRTTSRRIITAKKLFNIREGWTKEEDTLPSRFLSGGMVTNGAESARLPRDRLQAMIRAY